MPTDIKVTVKPGILVPVVQLTGEIDLSNVKWVDRDISSAVPNTALGLVLDLTSVTYIDSSGIHLLYDLERRLRERQQRLGLVVPSKSHIFKVLSLTGVPKTVQTYEDAEEGSRLLMQDPRP